MKTSPPISVLPVRPSTGTVGGALFRDYNQPPPPPIQAAPFNKPQGLGPAMQFTTGMNTNGFMMPHNDFGNVMLVPVAMPPQQPAQQQAPENKEVVQSLEKKVEVLQAEVAFLKAALLRVEAHILGDQVPAEQVAEINRKVDEAQKALQQVQSK